MYRGTHAALPDERNARVLIDSNGALAPRDQAEISGFDNGHVLGDGRPGALTRRWREAYLAAIERSVTP